MAGKSDCKITYTYCVELNVRQFLSESVCLLVAATVIHADASSVSVAEQSASQGSGFRCST